MEIKERLKIFIEFKKIPVSQFEKACGLSNGYVSSMRKGLGGEKLSNVLNAFPDLNREWLLYGEGEMLRSSSSVVQNVGNISAPVSGSVNSVGAVGASSSIDKALLAELSAQRGLTQKAQEQIDRLISVIEQLTKSGER